MAAVQAMEAMPSDPVRIWKSAMPDLLQWIRDVLHSGMIVLPRFNKGDRQNDMYLFSDGCALGYGGVLITPSGEIMLLSKKFSEFAHTHSSTQTEITSCERVLSHFTPMFKKYPSSHVNVVLDNAASIYLSRKGFSTNYHVNYRLRFLLRTLRSAIPDHNVSFHFIQTALNPADDGSRLRTDNFPVVEQKVTLSLDAILNG